MCLPSLLCVLKGKSRISVQEGQSGGSCAGKAAFTAYQVPTQLRYAPEGYTCSVRIYQREEALQQRFRQTLGNCFHSLPLLGKK